MTTLSPPRPTRAARRRLGGVARGLSPRSRRRRRRVIPAVFDLASLALAAVIAPAVTKVTGTPGLELSWSAALASLTALVLVFRGAYGERRSGRTVRSGRGYVFAATLAAGAVALIEDVMTGGTSSVALVVPWMLVIAMLLLGRATLDAAVRRGWVAMPGWRTIIVGAGGIGRLVARRVERRDSLHLEPVGMIDQIEVDELKTGLPLLGRIEDLEAVVDEVDAEHVIVVFPHASYREQLDLIRRCEVLGLGVSLVPRLYSHVTTHSTVEHLGGLPLLTTEPVRPRSLAFAVKHGIDRVVALIGLIVLAPVLAGAAIAIRITMGSPVLFRQLRVGRDERMFTMFKFRSMLMENPGIDDDGRVTRLGRFLRTSSIDELPQLVNVLLGHMSLIGPRPEQPHLAETFSRTVSRYGERHRVKSGITGWAQVHGLGRGQSRYEHESLAERVEWDNYYAENWSPMLDVHILAMTFVALLRFRQS